MCWKNCLARKTFAEKRCSLLLPVPQRRRERRAHRDHHHRRGASARHAGYRPEPRRRPARFHRTQLIRAADENVIHREHPPAHPIRRLRSAPANAAAPRSRCRTPPPAPASRATARDCATGRSTIVAAPNPATAQQHTRRPLFDPARMRQRHGHQHRPHRRRRAKPSQRARPGCRISTAKIGSSAVAPPNSTANRSSETADRISLLSRTKRMPFEQRLHVSRRQPVPLPPAVAQRAKQTSVRIAQTACTM